MVRPRLSRSLIADSSFADASDLHLPSEEVWDLPEKVLQFGSGRFLRAFADCFIDQANRKGLFGGRVAVVQSTGGSRTNLLNEQNGLYTLCVRGLKEGKPVEELSVLASVSRALPANEAWIEVLKCAQNPHLEVIISNTTEVGIVLDPDDAIEATPPRSFPGKLVAFLYARFQAFDGARDKGLVLIPCELITNNGDTLKEIVLQLADRWELGQEFATWVESCNLFCNSLVDRIVTGTPESAEVERIQERLGYEDHLLTVAEVYSLWAISGDESLKERLPFLNVSDSIIVANDITPYRERKIRILNGTHTISTPLSFFVGNNTILEGMNHPFTSDFIRRVMCEEIGPSLDVDPESVDAFIRETLDRFRNPYLQHLLLDITFQSTSKIRLRIVPSIQSHYARKGEVPLLLCLGFAFYLWFMKGVEEKDGKVFGRRGGELHPINDDQAKFFFTRWTQVDETADQQILAFVNEICRSSQLWGTDLTKYPSFAVKTGEFLARIARESGSLEPGQWL